MQIYRGNTQNRSTHPAVIAAGVAVVLFCAVGTAAVMGWIPGSGKDAAPVAAAVALAQPAAKTSSHQVLATPVHRVQGSTQSAHAATVYATTACSNCGRVESTRAFSVKGQGSGLGMAGGAVVGGLLGNQVGGGRGQDVMTVVGALGGAYAGNQIETRVKSVQAYEIGVRLNDGSLRMVQQSTEPQWHNGDRVRIVDGVVKADA